ncbi:MAG: ATP-binding cassette domain-containing protein, partial [Gammaproteobacteria bacterium]|nr:ATP-binding cassette domain-containing protein [Gammaproteobacteria bacterium]
MKPLLSVRNLSTWFETSRGRLRAVDNISFDIAPGEVFALLGESGSGKSLTALSLMRLLPGGARSHGEIWLRDVAPGVLPAATLVGPFAAALPCTSHDLLRLPEIGMREIRGGRIAMIFQEPMTSLNPVLSVGVQIGEALKAHHGLGGKPAQKRAIELLDAVGITEPGRRIHDYPHQLSGGMKQRVMIAIALAGEPELLIADEPTTALDVTIQAQILGLLRKLQKERGMALLLITHDLGVVSEMADRVAVMYAGEIVELAPRAQFFTSPKHPYTQKLFDSLPGREQRGGGLAVIRGTVPPLTQIFTGCRFAPRCDFAWQTCHEVTPALLATEGGMARCHLYDANYNAPRPAVPATRATAEMAAPELRASMDETLLKVTDLKVYFPIRKGLFKRKVGEVRAVDGVSLALRAGQTLALVGESGCGKTTVGKSILRLLPITSGDVHYGAVDLDSLRGKALRAQRGALQIIFQDPHSSMNPRMMIADIIAEGMIAQRVGGDERERLARIDHLLQQVGLSPDVKYRYPHEFSGGQRQRICIARALAVNPKVIICDGPNGISAFHSSSARTHPGFATCGFIVSGSKKREFGRL